MIIHRKLSKIKKTKFSHTCLQGNYGDSLGEFSNTSYGVVGAERVKNKLFQPKFIFCFIYARKDKTATL